MNELSEWQGGEDIKTNEKTSKLKSLREREYTARLAEGGLLQLVLSCFKFRINCLMSYVINVYVDLIE